MPTPDFEEWLERQDIDLQYTTTKEKWRQYMIDQFGFKKGTLDIAENVRESQYGVLEPLHIRAIEIEYQTAYQHWMETRYAISEQPGLWGAITTYRIAERLMTERGEYELAEVARLRWKELETTPTRRRYLYED